MSIKFEDRVSAYPNRYRVTPESGEPYYITLERADEPTNVGTPLNAATMNQLVALADIQNLPNMYLWKKYIGDPSMYTETEVTNYTLSSKLSFVSSYPSITYGDSYTYSDGAFILNNKASVIPPGNLSDLETELRGKYVLGKMRNGNIISICFIPENATISQVKGSDGYLSYNYLKVNAATKIDANYLMGYVMDEESGAYPSEGTNEDDGYWYVYHKQFGE